MFKLDLSDTFEWPVKFTTVNGKGQRQTHAIKLEFQRFGRDELVDLVKGNGDIGERTGAEVLDADVDYLLQFVVGWKDVQIGDSTDFNRDNLRTLLSKVPGVEKSITEEFFKASNGAYQAKN